MADNKPIKGFSRLSTDEKIKMVVSVLDDPAAAEARLRSFHHSDRDIQNILSSLSENTLSNFPLPFGVAPNFLINDRLYMVPMVTEESSVVAAAASAAGFWASRGGFRVKRTGKEKGGQFHFFYRADPGALMNAWKDASVFLRQEAASLLENMEKRGGGLLGLDCLDRNDIMPGFFQLDARFDTVDAMGANFINSCLESFGASLRIFIQKHAELDEHAFEPLMAILSNYSPDCRVRVEASCRVSDLGEQAGMDAGVFARRFVQAMKVADEDVNRAVTHNKGIMNGVDSVILATGNDFRAVEAAAHAWAARSGKYRSLSGAGVENDIFSLWLDMPMAIGTRGGLTRLHPLASLALDILGNPGAEQLMMVAASAGMASNFAALRSLVTTGIQAGHMRMHLSNILLELKAGEEEKSLAAQWFAKNPVSFRAVQEFILSLRNNKS